MEVLPTMERSLATTSIIEMPYATKLLGEELQTYLNMGMRFLTADTVTRLEEPLNLPTGDMITAGMSRPLEQVPNRDVRVPMYKPLALQQDAIKHAEDELNRLGGVVQPNGEAEIVDVQQAQLDEEAKLSEQKPEQPQQLQPQQLQPQQLQQLQPQQLQPQQVQQLQPQQPQQPQQLQPQQVQQLQPQQLQPPQIQFGGYSQLLQPMAGGAYQYVSPAPYPGGQPTIVIDTQQQQQQQQQGYEDYGANEYNENSQASQGSQMGGRRTTQRLPRQGKITAGGESVNPTARITIRKLG
jgi:hypothetical protein